MLKLGVTTAALFLFTTGAVTRSLAQSQEAATGTDTTGTVTVTGVPLEESVLPTIRPFDSAYGVPMSITDTPRNVTIISREQLDQIDIRDVRDFTKLTSSSYTQSNFGAPANPFLRGQVADVFVNGMRRGLTSNGNGLPIDFNSVESVSIFKGPPSVVQGASQYVGGSVNLVTKRPYFDKFQGNASTTIGEYDQYRWQLDFGGPIIKNELAYRISYSGEESGSFYDFGHLHSTDVYAALTWTPTAAYTLELNSEFFTAGYVENFGINRVTQDLIDNGTYITGAATHNNFGGGPTPALFDSGFGVVVSPTGTVNLPRSRRVLRPGDGSEGKSYEAQAIQTLKINDALSIVNDTFFYYVDRRTLSSYRYSEVLNDNFAVENRTEFHLNFDVPITHGQAATTTTSGKDGKEVKMVKEGEDGWSIGNVINAGIDFRYQHVQAINDFYHEPVSIYDLTKDPRLIRFPIADITKGFNASVPIPGTDTFGTPGATYGFDPATKNIYNSNNDTNDSSLTQFGLFFEHNIKLTSNISLLYGARGDLLAVKDVDPLPPPGFDAKSDYTIAGEGNANISPTYKPTSWSTVYFTYNFSQSSAPSNGGGFALDQVTNTLHASAFHRKSELYEAGTKFDLLDHSLFIGTAVFQQTRNFRDTFGNDSKVLINGLEIEANYQPNRNFFATLAYSALDSKSPDGGFQVTGDVLNAFDASRPDIIKGTDVGSPTFVSKAGKFRTPGLPQHLVTGLLNYKLDCGLGASLDMVVTSPFNLGYFGTPRVPWQYTLDASIYYIQPRYEVKLSVLNFTDQKNFSPSNPVYAADAVTADLPIRVEGKVTLKF